MPLPITIKMHRCVCVWGVGEGVGRQIKRQKQRDSDTGKECCDDRDGWRGDLMGAASV